MAKTMNQKRTVFGAVAALTLATMASFVAIAPAQAVCTGAYFSVNTAAQATAKVPTNCTNGSTIRARKNWYYTDDTNASTGSSYGPWIGSSGQASVVYLPSGRFHKSNVIESQ